MRYRSSMRRGQAIMRRPSYEARREGRTGCRCRYGFSMLELLVTVAIILILTTLYWSPNSGSRQRSLQTACQKSLQKVYIALDVYANDWGGRFPNVRGAHTSGEALDLLVPKYTSDTASFICPGSHDSEPPPGSSLAKHNVSYAYYMGRGVSDQQVVMSDKQVDTKAKEAGQQVFSTTGKPPGNNHRKYGGNFLFCDGHVELSPAAAAFSLPLTNGEVLLNP